MNYKIIRPILFRLSPELSHTFSLKAMKALDQIKLLKIFTKQVPRTPKTLFGLKFENPVGLAAGLDKNGDYIDALAALGFGFLEVGTVTPRPQPGNQKPRMFRLVKEQAIINRMGFNNKGVDYLVSKVQKKKFNGVLGINIGKNATTPIENAIDDYRACLLKVYPYASYVTINVSSPNTPGLRQLQAQDQLFNLLQVLRKEQLDLAERFNTYVPMLIKIAPDLSSNEISQMARAIGENKIDGVIATNTTLDRDLIPNSIHRNEAGGLSGQPLFEKSTQILTVFKKELATFNIPLIASGGIMSPEQACAKIEAGADLIQLYSGLIFSGPELISACCAAIRLSEGVYA